MSDAIRLLDERLIRIEKAVNLEKPDRKRYGDLEDSEEAYQRAMKYYHYSYI